MVDFFGNALSVQSSGSGTAKVIGASVQNQGRIAGSSQIGSTSNGVTVGYTFVGGVENVFVQQTSIQNYTKSTVGLNSSGLVVNKQTFNTTTPTAPTFSTPNETSLYGTATSAAPNLTPGDYNLLPGMQDGAGQIWTVDQQGAKAAYSAGPPVVNAYLYPGQLRGFDMVNGYDYGNLNGCRTS